MLIECRFCMLRLGFELWRTSSLFSVPNPSPAPVPSSVLRFPSNFSLLPRDRVPLATAVSTTSLSLKSAGIWCPEFVVFASVLELAEQLHRFSGKNASLGALILSWMFWNDGHSDEDYISLLFYQSVATRKLSGK